MSSYTLDFDRAYWLEFELQGLPRLQTNNYGHWSKRSKTKSEWEERVYYEVIGAASRGNTRPRVPLKRAQIKLVRYSNVEPDYDNLVASFKPILDGLTKAGVIEDDKRSAIGRPVYRWESIKRGKGRIAVRVIGVCDG